jgi:hypothetical protein
MQYVQYCPVNVAQQEECCVVFLVCSNIIRTNETGYGHIRKDWNLAFNSFQKWKLWNQSFTILQHTGL